MSREISPDQVSELREPAGDIRWYGVVLLVGHVALLVLGAVSLWRIAGGWWIGAAAAAVFVLAYAAGWRFWLAQGTRGRLGYKERLTVTMVVGRAVVLLSSLAGLWLPALIATSVVLLGDALNERSE